MLTPYRPRVLVVESRPAYQDWLLDLLRQVGYEPLAAATAAEALDLAASEYFDAILCDAALSDSDGPSLLRALGVHRPGRAVLVAQDVGHKLAKAARRAGYDACVSLDGNTATAVPDALTPT